MRHGNRSCGADRANDNGVLPMAEAAASAIGSACRPSSELSEVADGGTGFPPVRTTGSRSSRRWASTSGSNGCWRRSQGSASSRHPRCGTSSPRSGSTWYQPDRDITFYVFGSCVAVLLAITLERAWRRSGEQPGIKVSILPGRRVAIMLALVPTIPFWLDLAFHNSLLLASGLSRSTSVLMMMPGLAAAAVLFLLRGRPSLADGWAVPRAPDVQPHDGERQAAGLAGGKPVQSPWSVARRLFDVGMVAFITSLVYITDWKLISLSYIQ